MKNNFFCFIGVLFYFSLFSCKDTEFKDEDGNVCYTILSDFCYCKAIVDSGFQEVSSTVVNNRLSGRYVIIYKDSRMIRAFGSGHNGWLTYLNIIGYSDTNFTKQNFNVYDKPEGWEYEYHNGKLSRAVYTSNVHGNPDISSIRYYDQFGRLDTLKSTFVDVDYHNDSLYFRAFYPEKAAGMTVYLKDENFSIISEKSTRKLNCVFGLNRSEFDRIRFLMVNIYPGEIDDKTYNVAIYHFNEVEPSPFKLDDSYIPKYLLN